MKNENENWKNWVFKCVLFSCLALSVIGTTNCIVDPLWQFGSNGWWNKYREGFDERLLKTNYLSHVIDEIDGIVIGSSMSWTSNTKDFNELKIYNYACPALRPEHATEFIRHAASEKDGKLVVFMGLDFWSMIPPTTRIQYEPPSFYIENSKRNKLRDIFSIDSFGWALKSLMSSVFDIYHTDNEYTFTENFPMRILSKDLNLINVQEKAKAAVGNLRNHQNYTASPLEKLRKNIIDLDIQPVFYITPVTKAYLAEVIKIGAYPAYERFIRDAVNIFDPVPIWNFMYINSATVSDKYFYDPVHTNSRGGRAIAQRISGGHDHPADFGILVNKDNLEEHIRFLRENVFEALSGDCK